MKELKLEENITIYNGIGLILGATFGLGIFASPARILRYAKSTGLALCLASISGLISLFGVLCFVELGSMIPKSEDEYTYISIAYGPYIGFLSFWSFFLQSSLWQSMVAYQLGKHIMIAIANLMDDQKVLVRHYVSDDYFDPNCEEHDVIWPAMMIGISVVLIATFINCYNTNLSRIMLDIFSFFSVLGFVIVIIGSINYLMNNDRWKGRLTWEGSTVAVGDYGQGIYWGLLPYVGWGALNAVTSEMKNPIRDLPKALMASIFTLLIIYTLTTMSVYLIVPKADILSNTVYTFYFASEVFGEYAGYFIITITIIFAIISTFNAYMIIISRMTVSAAENQQIPQCFSWLHSKRRTPVLAVLLYGLSTLILLSTFITTIPDHMDEISDIVGFIETVRTTFTCFCVVVLRKTKPEWDRPKRVSLIFPFLYVTLCLVVIGFAIQQSYHDFGIAILIMCTIIPVFFAKKYFKSIKKASKWYGYKIEKVLIKLCRFLQKLFLVASPDLEEMPLHLIKTATASSITNDPLSTGMKNDSRPCNQNSQNDNQHQSLEIQSKELLIDNEKCIKESLRKNQIHNVKIDPTFKKYESKFKNLENLLH